MDDDKVLANIAYLENDLEPEPVERALAHLVARVYASVSESEMAAWERLELHLKAAHLRRQEELPLLDQERRTIARILARRTALPTVEYVYREKQTRDLLLAARSSLEKQERLEDRVRFLETQLRGDRPFSQLYKLGAGSLFVALMSLAFWAFTGIGAPFHPIFAAAVVPASIGAIAMAFLIRRDKQPNGATTVRDAGPPTDAT